MAGVRLIAAVAALALSGAVASVAHADPLNDPAKVMADRNQWAPQTQHKTFEWDPANGRVGLKFDYEQQVGPGAEYKNVQAGAFFKITPSVRVGAGVSLSDQQNAPSANPLAQTPTPPRVHLETTWKF